MKLASVLFISSPQTHPHEASLMSRDSLMLLSGCFLMILGVGLSGWAGKLRGVPEQSRKEKITEADC